VNRSISRLSTSRWSPYAVAGTLLLADHLCSVAARVVVFTLMVMWAVNQLRHYQTAPPTPAEGTKAPTVR
jgi:hypothetical protein